MAERKLRTLTCRRLLRLISRLLAFGAKLSPLPGAGVYSAHCAATERARDERVAVAGSECCGCRSTAGRYCREPWTSETLRPGSGDRPAGIVPQRAWRPGARQEPLGLDTVSARRSQVGWTKAVSDINPGRVARLRSHNTPTTGFGNEASPCRSPGGKDHPHNRPTGRFRSSARWHLPGRAQRKFSSSQER